MLLCYILFTGSQLQSRHSLWRHCLISDRLMSQNVWRQCLQLFVGIALARLLDVRFLCMFFPRKWWNNLCTHLSGKYAGHIRDYVLIKLWNKLKYYTNFWSKMRRIIIKCITNASRYFKTNDKPVYDKQTKHDLVNMLT